MPIFEIILSALLVSFVFAIVILWARTDARPANDRLRDEVASILVELTPEQLEAVNLWAWGCKSGWSVVSLDNYPLMRKRLDEDPDRM